MKLLRPIYSVFVCSFFATLACSTTGGDDTADTGGTGAGPGVSSGGTGSGIGGAVGAGGALAAGGSVSTGGVGTGGAGLSTGGAGSGGETTGVGGDVVGSGGVGTGGADAGVGGTGSGGEGSGGEGTGGDGTGGVTEDGCPAGAVICDDFEDGTLSQWNINQQGGTLSVGTAFANSGTKALLVDTQPGSNNHGGYIRATGAPLFPLPNNVIYGRAMVLYEGVNGKIPTQHTDIVRAADASSNVPFYNLGSQTNSGSKQEEILLNYYVSYPDEDCWVRPSPGYKINAQEWMCWEWHFDGNTNQLKFYINGDLEVDLTEYGDGCVDQAQHVWDAPEFGSFQIGAYISEGGATENQKIWIDDVAVGTSGLLGCPAQ